MGRAVRLNVIPFGVSKGMPAKKSVKKSVGFKRRKLSPDRIVSTALRLVDRDGVEALSMRTLAAALKVEAMSLYGHVRSKADLLGMICERLIDELPLPGASDPPRERLIRFCVDFRSIGHRHPFAFPLLVLLPQRMEVAALPSEHVMRAVSEIGLNAQACVRAQRTILAYVRGYTLWEIGGFATGRRSSPGAKPAKVVANELKVLDSDNFRMVLAYTSELMKADPDAHFVEGLEAVLDGLDVPRK